MKLRNKGIVAALSSAFFLGLAPVFGRQAILLGMPPLAVVAVRTSLAAALLFLVMFIFQRRFLFIYPAGLLGCLIAGWINGLGSLFYYSALGRINAGLGQLLYSLYPLFLLLWLSLDSQPPTRLTIFRLILVIPALVLLIDRSGDGSIDLIGVVEMLIASALYALHLPFNQRVLYDMPAPTVTLYTLLAMSAMVVPVYLFSGTFTINTAAQTASAEQILLETRPFWGPVLGLTLVTFLSRLTLFMGVKHLGGMQTALLGLSELLVTLAFAHWWLDERFTTQQWVGALLLVASLMLVGLEKQPPRRQGKSGFLSWLGSARLPADTFQPYE
jgi:drug/metabolite transporter (DMT)-like permease